MHPGVLSYTDQQGFVHPYETRELAYHGHHALDGLACACQRRTIPGATVTQLGALREVPARGTAAGVLTDLALLAGIGAISAGVLWFAMRK
jgi:hypothetical protein